MHKKNSAKLFSRISNWLDDSILYPSIFILTNKINYYQKIISKGFKKKNILFYPEKPDFHYALYKLCQLSGYGITNNPDIPADLVISFEDTTIKKESVILDDLKKKQRVLNIDCKDISKKKVGEVFSEVFGYNMTIDPNTYQGACVRKSDVNATHDGTVVQCPTKSEETYTYQKLINNEVDEKTVIDFRVCVIGGKIPIVVKRYKSILDRFDHTDKEVVANTEDLFKPDEIKKISEFCKKFGIDYGELDVLRDRDDNRIYIVDVNNTPYGPRRGREMDKIGYDRLFLSLSEAFESEFFSAKNPNA